MAQFNKDYIIIQKNNDGSSVNVETNKVAIYLNEVDDKAKIKFSDSSTDTIAYESFVSDISASLQIQIDSLTASSSGGFSNINGVLSSTSVSLDFTSDSGSITITPDSINNEINIDLDSGILQTINDVSTEVQNITSDIDTLNSNVSGLSSSVSTITSDVGNLQADVGNLQTNVSTLNSQVSTITGDIILLNSQVSTISSNVDLLQIDVNGLETNVSTILSSYVTSVNSITGAVSINGTNNEISISEVNNDITISLDSNFVQRVVDIEDFLDGFTGGITADQTILIGTNGIEINESPSQTWTISVSGDYALNSYVDSVSGSLQTQIDSISAAVDSIVIPDVSNFITTSEVASISGDLQNQINNIIQEGTTIESSGGSIVVTQDGINWNIEVASAPIQNHNDLIGLQGDGPDYYHLNSTQFAAISGGVDLSAYTLLTTTSSISAGLDSRLIAIESDYLTSADITGFALQTTVDTISGDLDALELIVSGIVSEQTTLTGGSGIQVSNVGYNWTVSVSGDYALNSYVDSVSGSLQSQIDSIIQEGTTIESSSGTIVVTQNGLLYNVEVSDYISLTEVASISAGLDSRLITIESDYLTSADITGFALKTTVDTISGDLDALEITVGNIQTDLNNLNSVVDSITSSYVTSVNNITGSVDLISGEGISISGSGNSLTISVTGDYALNSYVDSVSGNLQSQINLKANDSDVVHLTGNETIAGIKTFSNDVVVNGDFYVNGTQTIVNSTAVSAADNQIVINAGEVGPGVTAGYAGIRVDRGSELPYDFQFRESDDSFVIGISGDYQKVATREDTPINGGFAQWNNSEFRFDTTTDVASLTTVASISGSLQTQIDSISAAVDSIVIPDVSNFITTSEVASISAGLDSRLITIESDYLTSADITGFALQTIVDTISGDLDALESTVAGIVSETTTLSAGNGISVSQNGYNWTVSVSGDYALNSYVDSVSGSLQSQITSNDNDIAAISGSLSNYVLKSGDTMTGQLTVQDANISIHRTGSPAAYYAERHDGTMLGIGAGSTNSFFRFDSTGGFSIQTQPRADLEAQNGSNTVNRLTITSAGEVTLNTGGLTITPLAGNTDDIITLDANGKLLASGTTLTSLQSQITSNDNDIAAISGSLGNYVLKVGDTMTGTLVMSGAGIQLDINHTPAHSEGTIFYNNVEHTLCYYNDDTDVTVNVGQEEVVRVRNNTGDVLLNGTVVYINGALGNRPTVAKADKSTEITSHSTLGVVTADIQNNSDGYITVTGLVNGLDTSAFTEGNTLYLGNNGLFTETAAEFPDHLVKIGYVVTSNPTIGRILVTIDIGKDIQELDNVIISSTAEGDLLTVGASGEWSNYYNVSDFVSLATIVSISGDLQSQITSNDNDIASITGSYTLLTTTASISANLQSQINGKANTSHTHIASDITDFSEAVDDRVSNLLVAGNNINLSYDDGSNELTISANISGSSSLLQGYVECDTVNDVYTVSHTSVDLNFSFPTISLIVPVSGSNLFVQGITNRTTSSFDVVLSEVPNVTGYAISWHLPTTNASIDSIPVINLAITNIPSSTVSSSGNYNISLDESVVYADADATFLLPATPTANESHWIVNDYTSDITIDGNGKNIKVDGILYPTFLLPINSSLHIHFNQTKNRWYVL